MGWMLTPAGTRDGDGGRRDRAHQIGGRSTSSPRIARSMSGSFVATSFASADVSTWIARARVFLGPGAFDIITPEDDGVETTFFAAPSDADARTRNAGLESAHALAMADMFDVPLRCEVLAWRRERAASMRAKGASRSAIRCHLEDESEISLDRSHSKI